MPGMLVDDNQSTGTMVGLSSQLVLIAKDTMKHPRPRRVLIPFGTVDFQPLDNHIRITVDTRAQTRVRYQEYIIDTDLGCLVGNVSLVSKLYKIYLHAVSSYCLPDILTGRTGTEQALYELRSAACQSFQKLDADEAHLLKQIRSLTPNRTFYPAHLEVMQTIKWSSLTPLAQQHQFFTITGSIMKYATLLQAFPGRSEVDVHDFSTSASSINFHLLDRAARRNGVYYPVEFAGQPLRSGGDVIHTARDHTSREEAKDGAFVFAISSMVYHWSPTLMTTSQLFDTLKDLGNILSGEEVDLSYSRDWLERDLGSIWISLYNLCRSSSRHKHRFQLAFSLSSMAYSSIKTRNLIPTILAFATVPQFQTLNPPHWLFYELHKGIEWQREEVTQIVSSSAVSFEDTPDSELPVRANNQEDAAVLRQRHSTFQSHLQLQAKELTEYLRNQWPCEEPQSPPTASDGYVLPDLLITTQFKHLTGLLGCLTSQF
jgi:hypothetical protein